MSTTGLGGISAYRLEKLHALQQLGVDPFHATRYDRTHMAETVVEQFPALEGQNVKVCGRLLAIRVHGRAAFADLYDESGRLQIHIREDVAGEAAFQVFGALDLGDIVGVAGTVFRTRRGEVSVEAHELTVLAKSLKEMPEKRHGLKDVDLRYRHRYLDLLANPEVRQAFLVRSRVVAWVRQFLDQQGFIEVETPVLQNIAGGTEARPFITHHHALDMDLYLRIALELHLKRLIVGGFERVYEIGRVFRNEGLSSRHNPEFTLLELYQAYTDYAGIMALVEDLLAGVVQHLFGAPALEYQGQALDFRPPFPRVDLAERFLEKTGVAWDSVATAEDALALARRFHVTVEHRFDRAQVMDKLVSELIEPELIQPTFLWHHPVELSPLAKRDPKAPSRTERFELFVAGRELANAFSELNDPVEQRERFLDQMARRNAGNDEAQVLDEDFLNALEHGMPPTGGLGIGMDRLVMLLTNSAAIRDVILFPTMRPLESTPSEEPPTTGE